MYNHARSRKLFLELPQGLAATTTAVRGQALWHVPAPTHPRRGFGHRPLHGEEYGRKQRRAHRRGQPASPAKAPASPSFFRTPGVLIPLVSATLAGDPLHPHGAHQVARFGLATRPKCPSVAGASSLPLHPRAGLCANSLEPAVRKSSAESRLPPWPHRHPSSSGAGE